MAERWIFHRSGHLCLDFANTVSWRRSDRPIERLREYGDLVEWARQSGMLTTPAAHAVVRSARRRPALAARILARARALREVIYRPLARPRGPRAPRPRVPRCASASASHPDSCRGQAGLGARR